MFIQQPFDEFLEMEYERTTENSVRVKLPIKELYVDSNGLIHGGVISTLAEVALCNTVPPDEQGRQQAVTVDLNVTFLKSSNSSLLIARAFAVKEGHNLIHADCLIYDDGDHVIAKAKAVLFNK